MKQLRCTLALLLCMLLLSGSLSAALTEEFPAPADTDPTSTAEATVPDPDPATAEPTATPDASPTAEATFAPEASSSPAAPESSDAAPTQTAEAAATDEPDAEPTSGEAPAVDCTRSARYSPAFMTGYAQLLSTADGYSSADDDEIKLRIRSGEVYASARRGDRLLAHFDGGDGVISVWISDEQLRPMSEDEVAAFRAANSNAKRCFNDDPGLPLAALDYEPISPVAPEMLLGANSLTLGAGESCALPISFSDGKAHSFSCTSSNKSYVKVTDGVVQGVRYGKSATITVTSEFGQSATLKVSVLRAPSSISVQPAQADLCPG